MFHLASNDELTSEAPMAATASPQLFQLASSGHDEQLMPLVSSELARAGEASEN